MSAALFFLVCIYHACMLHTYTDSDTDTRSCMKHEMHKYTRNTHEIHMKSQSLGVGVHDSIKLRGQAGARVRAFRFPLSTDSPCPAFEGLLLFFTATHLSLALRYDHFI